MLSKIPTTNNITNNEYSIDFVIIIALDGFLFIYSKISHNIQSKVYLNNIHSYLQANVL